jgi:hypothetical protein
MNVMIVSKNIRCFLKTIGQKGGKARARRLASSTLSAQARQAATSRWMKKYFGVDRFEALSLPGWEIVDSGLRDLSIGNSSTIDALAVIELRPRLRFLGVPVPKVPPMTDPHEILYRAMEKSHGGMAHERFTALLARLDSFCDALATIIVIPKPSAHKSRRWCA